MKDSNKDKWAFLFQYAGQEVIERKLFNLTPEIAYPCKNCHASLRPIESLTDEEHLFIGKDILGWDYLSNEGIISNVKEFLSYKFMRGQTNISSKDWNRLFDHLRSIEIAVPFRGWTVEEMISWGWVKLRESKERIEMNKKWDTLKNAGLDVKLTKWDE